MGGGGREGGGGEGEKGVQHPSFHCTVAKT